MSRQLYLTPEEEETVKDYGFRDYVEKVQNMGGMLWICTCKNHMHHRLAELVRFPEGGTLRDSVDESECPECKSGPEVIQRFLNEKQKARYEEQEGHPIEEDRWFCTHTQGFFTANRHGFNAYILSGKECDCGEPRPPKPSESPRDDGFPRAVLMNAEERAEAFKRWGRSYGEEGSWMCVGHVLRAANDFYVGDVERFPTHGARVYTHDWAKCNYWTDGGECGSTKPTPMTGVRVVEMNYDGTPVADIPKKDSCCGYGDGNPVGPNHHTFCEKWKKLVLTVGVHDCPNFLVGMELIAAGCPICETAQENYCPRCNLCLNCGEPNRW